ncbi:MAG: hypothetical protein MMC33_003200 [Icmadophila ericetorum]|nr:hypothetical protein [Icmadophila ericetorum]
MEHQSPYTLSSVVHSPFLFDNGVTNYIPLLEPKKTKAGKIAVHQPHIEKKSSQYWKAQCLFRNLNQSDTIPVLQSRLRESRASMDEKLQEVEIRLNQEFLEKNAKCRDEKWVSLVTDEKKAKADLTRFLRETFAEGSSTDVAVLKTHFRAELQEAAKSLGLQTISENAPLDPDGSRPSIDRWIIIGRTRSDIYKEQSKLGREALRMKQKAAKLQIEQTKRLHKEVIAKSKAGNPQGTWDVTGNWKIKCPEIEEQWGDAHQECSLELYITIYTGVMRFVKSASEKLRPGLKTTGTLKRRRADSEDENADEEDDEDEEETDDEGRGGSRARIEKLKSEEFRLGPTNNPSPKHAKWSFRWRGEETGEGEITLGSDEELCQIKFGGPGGTELSGAIHTPVAGSCDFKGWKIGPVGSRPTISAEAEWEQRDESAHEYARKARWH